MATAQNTLSQTASSFFSNLNAHEHDDGLSAFAGVSARLFGIAYRMLGNAADADDIVQDVWLRWHSTNRRAVLDPPAFLATTATRLCINHVQSARSRRETSIEARLHEPVDTTCNPGLGAERSEALRHAMLLVVEKLSPTERAVLILREAFEYSYRQIADLLKMDIGIMPLQNDKWSEGKCGFKLIQYMALGIPAVASPVEVNNKIIDHGTNGFLCSSDDEWLNSLTQLIKDVSLRVKMGQKGKDKIVEHYSVLANTGIFLDLFN